MKPKSPFNCWFCGEFNKKLLSVCKFCNSQQTVKPIVIPKDLTKEQAISQIKKVFEQDKNDDGQL